MNRRKNGWLIGWMAGGWIDEWAGDQWMDGWVDGFEEQIWRRYGGRMERPLERWLEMGG